MMAKPAMAVPARAASTTLSGWRMCHAMRAASQDALSPLSTCSRAIAARSPASGVRAGSRRYAKTGPGIGRLSECRSKRSGERVEHVLHVVVLLQAVDEGQKLRRLGFGKLGRHGADVFVLGRERRETARLEGFLQASEIGEGAADHELRLALLAGALAHLVQAMVDEVELQIVLVDPRRAGCDAGSARPAFTAMVRSLAMRANCFAMRFQRANIVALRTSKMRPMPAWCTNAGARAKAPRGRVDGWMCRRKGLWPRAAALRRVAPAGCACAAAAGSGAARSRAIGPEAAAAPSARSRRASSRRAIDP